MKPAARLGDPAHCASDSHGGPCCPHTVSGPAVKGSADILINDKSALRVNDSGSHSSCCGSASWVIQRGSSTVIFNERPAARKDDATAHCGGSGCMIGGSGNVLIGPPEFHSRQNRDKTWISVRCVDEGGTPVSNILCRIKTPSGSEILGRTDDDGRCHIENIDEGVCEVSFPELDDEEGWEA
jgi:uncharacterized Zn-binding protein involved in type VI secretion